VTRVRRVTLAIALSLLAPLASAAEPAAGPDADFAAALGEAEANVKTPEGKRYDETFGSSFAQKERPVLVKCTKGLGESDLAGFDLVARVSDTGKLETVLVHPPTKVAECLRKGMATHGYPGPPRAHYWVHVQMTIK